MYNYKLKTSMLSHPGRTKEQPDFFNVIKIDRGGTADIKFSFANKFYSFSDIKQLTFIFKYGTGLMDYFMLKDENTGEIDYGSEDAGYNFSGYDEENDAIWLELKPILTLRYPANKPVEFEVAVKINDDDIIIERQLPLWPVATLYSEVENSQNQPIVVEYCSQTLCCSTGITCCR